STSTSETEGSEPTSGGTLTYIHTLEPRSWDPLDHTGATSLNGNSIQMYAVFDALAIEHSNGEVEPRVAESITSDDSQVWTITIREGVEFTDGTPFDAEAVKFNWERIADPANQSPGQASA